MRALVLLLTFLLPRPPALAKDKTEAPRLLAAAGKVDISPEPARRVVWLAGYGAHGRRALGVHDPLYARALVVSDGRRTVALVSVDALGLYRQDVEDIRRDLGWDGTGRYLFIAATHDHSAPDSLGLWGRWPGISGVDLRYHRALKLKVARLVRETAGRLEAARLSAASVRLDPRGLCRDSRDPKVLDPELNALSLRAPDGRTLGTLVRWSCHAEVLGESNRQATADFPGALCDRVEERTGGGCVFMPGLLGGLQTPDVERSESDRDFALARELGEKLADAALAGLEKADTWPSAEVGFQSQVARVPVDNSIYLLFLRSLLFGHTLSDKQGRAIGPWRAALLSLRHLAFFPLPDRARPWIETEVSLVRLGPVRVLGVPGELFPELALGGYDGSLSFGRPVTDPANPNPPPLDLAPEGPYLRELLKAKHGLIVGPANDEIGYIVPEYDFQTTRRRSMHPRPKGNHYEETNSVSRRAAPTLLNACLKLLEADAAPRPKARPASGKGNFVK